MSGTTGRACADCHATTEPLRWVRLLTSPDCWLCTDAQGCIRRRRERLDGQQAERIQRAFWHGVKAGQVSAETGAQVVDFKAGLR